MNSVAIALFTRDLRVRDNPMLAAAAAHTQIVPLFVIDEAMIAGPHACANRRGFLTESLVDLDVSLREMGSWLVVRSGDWIGETLKVAQDVGATVIHLARDYSATAQRRLSALTELAASVGIEVIAHDGVTVLAPGAVRPGSGTEFKVFTPYYNRWRDHPWRPMVAKPNGLRSPACDSLLDSLPAAEMQSPYRAKGGESIALSHLKSWTRRLADYETNHNDLAADATSRIAPYLHFGCLSPLEVAVRLRERDGAAPFVRQLCWRDFYHQILNERPEVAHRDFRDRGDSWNIDPQGFATWSDGHSGFPIVDAAMRQLKAEGFMHNRARMIVASFLTKDLYIDWRLGARHFMDWLVDGDVANNQLNWQWVAGTGSDTNPNRIFNPLRQAERFDPHGDYTRRYVVELAELAAPLIHNPDAQTRLRLGYPDPIVDHHEAIAAYRARS